MFCFISSVFIGAFALVSLSVATVAVPDTLELSPKAVQNQPDNSRLKAGQSEITLRSEAWQGRAISLPDILAEQAGIETRRYGGIGSFQTASIRGSSGSRLLVFLDGVPMNSAGGGAVDLGKINLDGIDRIEIRKGMAPASEGGNGMGGVVHLYSKLGQRNAEVTLGAGSFGLKRTAISGGTTNNRVSLLGNLAWMQAKNDFAYLDRNHTAYNLDDDQWTTRQNSAYRSLEAHTQANFNITPRQSLRLKMATSNNSGGLPGDEGAVTKTAGFSNTLYQYLFAWEVQEPANQNRFSAELSLDEETPEFHWTKADPIGLSFGRDTTVLKNRSSRTQLRLHGDYAWPTFLDWDFGSFWLLSLGQEKLRPVADDYAGTNPDRDNLRQQGALAGDFTLAKDSLLRFTLGANSEWIMDRTLAGINYYGDTLLARKAREWHPSGRIGALWSPRPSLSLFTNLGKFYHLPSLGDRFGGRWGLVPNPRLHEETGINFEIGLRQKWTSGYLEVCAFRNQIQDAILYIHSLNLVKAINLDATLTEGLEVTLDQALPFGLSTAYSATFRDSENQSQTYYAGLTLPDAPLYHHHLKTRIPFLKKFSLEQAWEYRTEIFRDPGNVQRIPAQNLLHATLHWHPINRIQLDASLQNITDTYYEDVYSAFPYPGRNFSMTITTKL
jgi:outer membrane cobalamin receptor